MGVGKSVDGLEAESVGACSVATTAEGKPVVDSQEAPLEEETVAVNLEVVEGVAAATMVVPTAVGNSVDGLEAESAEACSVATMVATVAAGKVGKVGRVPSQRLPHKNWLEMRRFPCWQWTK